MAPNSVMSTDETNDMADWLQHTGWHDIGYRKEQLEQYRQEQEIQAIEQQQAALAAKKAKLMALKQPDNMDIKAPIPVALPLRPRPTDSNQPVAAAVQPPPNIDDAFDYGDGYPRAASRADSRPTSRPTSAYSGRRIKSPIYFEVRDLNKDHHDDGFERVAVGDNEDGNIYRKSLRVNTMEGRFPSRRRRSRSRSPSGGRFAGRTPHDYRERKRGSVREGNGSSGSGSNGANGDFSPRGPRTLASRVSFSKRARLSHEHLRHLDMGNDRRADTNRSNHSGSHRNPGIIFSDEHDEPEDIMDVDLGGPEETRFFMMRSFTTDNIYQSHEDGLWATKPTNINVLSEAFEECKNVILFFSANQTNSIQGYARMTGLPSKDHQAPEWYTSIKWSISDLFQVEWISKRTFHMDAVKNLQNELNEGKRPSRAMDGQEIDAKCGRQMVRIINAKARSTKVVPL